MSAAAPTFRRHAQVGKGQREAISWDNLAVQFALTVVSAVAVVGLGVLGRLSPRVLVLAPVIVAAVSLFLRHPKWCVTGVLAATVFGFYRNGLAVGPLDLRLIDIPFGFLVGWAVLFRARDGQSSRAFVGQPQIGLFLAVLGLSLSTYLADGWDVFVLPLASWLRLTATIGLVWLVPYAVRSSQDRVFLMRAFVLVSTAELARSEVLYFRSGGLGTRLYGSNGPNAEALIAVVVLLTVLNLPLFSRRVRVALGAIAALAIVLATSIGALTALAIVVGVHGLRATFSRSPRAAALLRPARILLVAVGAVLLIITLRPRDAPTSGAFNTSSTAQRLVFGYAGLQIFLDHPILGVGWQRSSAPDVIGSDELVGRVKSRFTAVRADLLPDEGGAATVHNAYIQVLAESGLVGIGLLAVALVAGVRGARSVIANAGPDSGQALCLAALLLAVLVWWNDNPLFGAQPETVLFAFFLGLLASLSTGPARDGLSGGRAAATLRVAP